MQREIENFIKKQAAGLTPNIWRKPLVGFADAADPFFYELASLITGHLHPTQLLPEAKTVLAFFLPFKKEIITGNSKGELASRQWAEAYTATNTAIDQICSQLKVFLKDRNINMAWLLPTYEFDKNRLVASWSHRHVAYACGLGRFGRNNMLITARGSGGRLGSAVIDMAIPPSPRPEHTHGCLSKKGCTYCQRICPAQALGPEGFNRHRCYKQLLINDNNYPELDSVEVCGKCVTGPCAYID